MVLCALLQHDSLCGNTKDGALSQIPHQVTIIPNDATFTKIETVMIQSLVHFGESASYGWDDSSRPTQYWICPGAPISVCWAWQPSSLSAVLPTTALLRPICNLPKWKGVSDQTMVHKDSIVDFLQVSRCKRKRSDVQHMLSVPMASRPSSIRNVTTLLVSYFDR